MSGIVNNEPIASSRQSIPISFPSGTKMVFNQTAAPTGWTKVTGSGDDHALRVTTGTVGTGGSVDFETALASQTPTISRPTATSGAVATHAISESELDAHGHQYHHRIATGSVFSAYHMTADSICSPQYQQSEDTGSNSAHAHGFTQPTISIPTSSAIDLDVKFVDIIIATKD